MPDSLEINLPILRKAFVDICKGYSVGEFSKKTIYVKHLGHKEHFDFELIQSAFEKQAKEDGLLTNQERLDYLKSKSLWTDKDDLEIEKQKNSIKRFEEGKNKASLPSMVKEYNKEIEKQKISLNLLVKKRNDLIGLTVESHAEKLVTDHYILKNIYLDKNFEQPLYEESDFDDLNDDEISGLINSYNLSTECCSDKNIKILSVQDFYQSYFFLCNDDLRSFYGKKIIDLTYFQVRLGNYSKYFKSLLENNDISKIPENKRNDPDFIEQFITTKTNSQKVLDNQKGRNVGLVGASKQDFKDLGITASKMPDKEMNKEELMKYWGA